MFKQVAVTMALFAAAIAAVGPASADSALPKGTVVVAKTAPDALLIWDASPVVADIVGQNVTEPAALQTIEEDGIAILRSKTTALPASSFELRVVYTRSGAVSPVYGTPTFAGVERLMVLKATHADILAHGAAWEQAAHSGGATPGLNVSITGKLPPAN